MQRLSAILLLVLFGFTLTMPLLPADSETKLPPCCRRDGKHGCGMKMKSLPVPSGAAWRASGCPMFGKGTVTPADAKEFAAPKTATYAALLLARPAAVEQTEARQRISFSRSRQKRGPPSFLA